MVDVTPGTVNFYIVKIFGNDGLWETGASELVAGIYECRDNNADIINMSLGGSTSNRKEERAFNSIYADGVLSIAAAGNDAVEDPHYPASYESVKSFATVDDENNQADFSNLGDHVELSAPGVDVVSTILYLTTNTLTVDGTVYTANHIEFASLGTASGDLANGGLCGKKKLDGLVMSFYISEEVSASLRKCSTFKIAVVLQLLFIIMNRVTFLAPWIPSLRASSHLD